MQSERQTNGRAARRQLDRPTPIPAMGSVLFPASFTRRTNPANKIRHAANASGICDSARVGRSCSERVRLVTTTHRERYDGASTALLNKTIWHWRRQEEQRAQPPNLIFCYK